MSWQAYVDQLTAQGLKQGAIVGHDGSQWAASAGFALKGDEGKKLASGFNDPNSALSAGIHVGGNKFLAIKADARSLYGKKGAGGIVVVKTGQAILIGVYDDTVQPGQAATAVEKLADYLIDNGY
jgi:profilin